MWSTSGYYNDGPVVSPDSKKLVFAKSGDLWIRDLATSDERRVTDAARRCDGEYSWVSIEVRGWSPLSDRLMYEIVRPDRFPRDTCGQSGPPPIIREAPYGLYLYDLKAGTTRAVTLPGWFVAWLSSQEVVATTEPNRFTSSQVRVNVESSEQKPLPFPSDRSCGQLAADREGSWLLASCYWDQKGQLMEMNLREGQLRLLTAEWGFGDLERPTFSPDGRRIAWVRRSRPPWDQPVGSLVIDSNAVFTCKPPGSGLDYRWIDDETILCDCYTDLFVIDASTGAVKGTTAHPVANP
jgi:Tol biopolymer transport system component